MSIINLTNLIRKKVRTLKPYHVEKFDCAIKLHANENPFPMPERIGKLFADNINKLNFNRYPDPDSSGLKQILTERLGVSHNQLIVGNGSDELILLLMQAFCDAGDTILYPDPTFAMYSIIARGIGLKPMTIQLDDCWDFEAETLLSAAEKTNAKMIFISYPNNPTGNCFSNDAIHTIIQKFVGIVVLDEAYYDFARKSFIDQLFKHNNLVILRSLSKIGLAALRVGYGVAHPLIISELNKIRLPYNSNAVSQAFSETALRNFPLLQEQIDHILAERECLSEAMEEISGLTVFPSDSNFILFKTDEPMTGLFHKLADRGILVRDLGSHSRLSGCLRVTVGTRQENKTFLDQLRILTQ